MYDVYVNEKRELLVLRSGAGVPPNIPGNWRKRKRTQIVSEEIRAAVFAQGRYQRKIVNKLRTVDRA